MFRFLSIQSVQLTCQVRHHQEYCGSDHEHLGTSNKTVEFIVTNRSVHPVLRTRRWHDEWHIPYWQDIIQLLIYDNSWVFPKHTQTEHRCCKNVWPMHSRKSSFPRLGGWQIPLAQGQLAIHKVLLDKCSTWYAFDSRDLGAQSLEVRELAWRLE